MSARTSVEVGGGRFLDFLDPKADQVELDDIVRGLGNACRFGGHVPRFYSVAEHALLVAHLVKLTDDPSPELELAALHHDSHEAYVGDLVTPLKAALGDDLTAICDALDRAIGEKFGIDPELFHDPRVKAADVMAGRMEAAVLKTSKGITGAWEFRELPNVPWPWSPCQTIEDAAWSFRSEHAFLQATIARGR